MASLISFAASQLKTEILNWQTKLNPWSLVVDKGFETAPGKLLFARIAASSTATSDDADAGVWHSDAFMPTQGLVERLYFARNKASDAAWWRPQLQNLTEEPAALALAVLLSWGEPHVLIELKSVFEAAVNELDQNSWSRLWSFFVLIAKASKGRRPELDETWINDAGAFSPRTALVMIDRVPDEEIQRELSRKMLRDYGGIDRLILRRAAGYEMRRKKPSEIDWEFVRDLSKLAKVAGLSTLLGMPRPHHFEVPEDIAKSVLNDCELHCKQIVAICERAYGIRIARKADKISTMAEKERWFTNPISEG